MTYEELEFVRPNERLPHGDERVLAWLGGDKWVVAYHLPEQGWFNDADCTELHGPPLLWARLPDDEVLEEGLR